MAIQHTGGPLRRACRAPPPPLPRRPQQQRALGTSRRLRRAAASAADAAARLLESAAASVSVRRQVLDANQLQKLAATLARPVLGCAHGTPVPPGHHLVYFTPGGTETQLGADGTDRTFSPSPPYTRRMWAGGRMSWPGSSVAGRASLLVGDEVEERTRLVGATAKKSRSAGDMVLVEVEKELRSPRGLSVVDRRAWLFRPDMSPYGTHAAPAGPIASGPTTIEDQPADGGRQPGFPVRRLRWSPVGLFRFSALTFNAHKIHYSPEWSRSVEGHAGIVVHGPLMLINMLDYWRDIHARDGREPASVDYRALSPVYAGETHHIRTQRSRDAGQGRTCDIVTDKDGVVCMKSEVVAAMGS